jgi:hypothetical protein
VASTGRSIESSESLTALAPALAVRAEPAELQIGILDGPIGLGADGRSGLELLVPDRDNRVSGIDTVST